MINKKMLISHIVGGLGNQMFQYATALSVATKNNAELKLDISDFETYTLHRYSLDKWNISSGIASSSEINSLTSKNIFFRNKFYQEKNFHFDNNLFEKKLPLYMKGYWQSEKYFMSVRAQLLKEFTPKNLLSDYSKIISDKIGNATISIALHVRRGDYLLDKNQQTHGVCSVEYYDNAISQFEKNTEKPIFFVFSDDIAWAKEVLKFNSEVVWCDGNDASRNFEDIFLMSLCSHNIIANSSFSWWGAWLNDNQGKKVIAPKAWFQTTKYNASDLYCSGWELL